MCAMNKFAYEWFFAWVRALAFPLVYWWEASAATLAEDPQATPQPCGRGTPLCSDNSCGPCTNYLHYLNRREELCYELPSSFFPAEGSLEPESLDASTSGILSEGR